MPQKYSAAAREILVNHIELRRFHKGLFVTYRGIPEIILLIYRCSAFIDRVNQVGQWYKVPVADRYEIERLNGVRNYWAQRIYDDARINLDIPNQAHLWLEEA